MEYYKEYAIRCKHCGELISTKSITFNELINSNYTPEEACNELDLMNFCCRMEINNPVTVFFNMENREVIEGIKSLDAVLTPDLPIINDTNPINPVFAACLGSSVPQQNVLPTFKQFAAPIQKETRTVQIVPGNDIIPQIGTIDDAPTGEAIDVTATNQTEFAPPHAIGLPTINPDPTFVQPTIYVGKDAQVRILNGRTFLAQ